MNKLLLSEKKRNHIKIMPLCDFDDIPDDEAGKINWCESKYNELQNSSEAVNLYLYKNAPKGYLISVWQLNNLYYLIQCIRNEFKTYNSVIYINNNENDTLNIAKFLKANIQQIMADYKQQILDARDYLQEHNNLQEHTNDENINATDTDSELPA